MKLTALTLAAAILAVPAMADGVVAPGDVTFDGSAVAQSLTGVPGDPAEGQSIYASKKKGNCVACHEISTVDATFPGNVGPPLDGVGDRYSLAELRGLLVDSKKTFEGTMMPAYYKVDGFIRPGKAYTGKAADDTFGPLLEAQQVEDVIAFLSTLKDE
jgi:sulfur-oxidizing protein SoxX